MCCREGWGRLGKVLLVSRFELGVVDCAGAIDILSLLPPRLGCLEGCGLLFALQGVFGFTRLLHLLTWGLHPRK